MATTYTTNVVCDNSSLANFTSWTQAISTAFSTLGWVQTNDTGQVVWTATVLTLTQVAVSGSNAVYSYSSYTGPAPRAGMSVIITGFATGANNVTATLTAVSGGSSGTVTVTKVSQANETHAGSATTTAISAVPSFTYVNEIWQANDAQAATLPIYIKMHYGVSSSGPDIAITVGCGSNGSGTITNALSAYSQYTPLSMSNHGATTYPCYFSGDAGEFRMIMWNTLGADTRCLIIERAKDSSGSKTASYFSILWFGASQARHQCCDSPGNYPAYETQPVACVSNRSTGYYNGTVAAFPVFPYLGYIGNPHLGVMGCVAADVTDNSTVTVASMYGSTHTYLVAKASAASTFNSFVRSLGGSTASAVLMRYE